MAGWIQRWRRWLVAGIFLGLLLALVLLFLEFRRIDRERSQDPAIFAAALRYNVHPALIKAVVWRESRFDSQARGTSGEIGLMQIREPTARDWAAAEKNRLFTHFQLFDPVKNTQCGSWYLRRLLNRYRQTDNPLAYALAAYNAGPAHVNRWCQGAGVSNSAVMLQQMDFPGTRHYVAAVSDRFAHYQKKGFPPKGWDRHQGLLMGEKNSP